MNNQIKELIKQATEVRQPAPHSNQTENSIVFNKEKFAELIVQECAEICRDRKLTPSAFTADELLEHFGVKE